MSKNIVLCSDGTGQAGGQGFVSNVWRLFKAVDRHCPEKKITKTQPNPIAKTKSYSMAMVLEARRTSTYVPSAVPSAGG